MAYLGGKVKQADTFISSFRQVLYKADCYIEPFCGSCSVLAKIEHKNRIANDIQPYLIALWKALQNGWVPPISVSKDEYMDIKNNKESYEPWLVGFVGFSGFRGKFFGSYAVNKDGRNYFANFKNYLIKAIQRMPDVAFSNITYENLTIPNNSLVYADPPYKGTESYGHKIDYNQFYEWCRSVSEHSYLFVSEFEMPDDFVKVAEYKYENTMGCKEHTKKFSDNLYIHESVVSKIKPTTLSMW